MKQHVTKEQWDEVSDIQKSQWKHDMITSKSGLDTGVIPAIDIGQMIEFLGEDYFYFGKDVVGWQLKSAEYKNIRQAELCDALWEAVKHKLNN